MDNNRTIRHRTIPQRRPPSKMKNRRTRRTPRIRTPRIRTPPTRSTYQNRIWEPPSASCPTFPRTPDTANRPCTKDAHSVPLEGGDGATGASDDACDGGVHALASSHSAR